LEVMASCHRRAVLPGSRPGRYAPRSSARQNFLPAAKRNLQKERYTTTNRPELIDDAIISRFSDVLDINPSDSKSREALVQAVAKQVGLKTDIPEDCLHFFGGLSGRDIKNIILSAMRIAAPSEPEISHYEAAMAKTRGKGATKVSAGSKWETLILPAKTIKSLKTIAHMVKDAEALTGKGIPVPKSLLLYGPPGTGKTEIARTLANESGVSFKAFSTADLKAMHLGHGANAVKQAFESARAVSPCIMFIDEIDSLTPSRDGEVDKLQAEVLTQFLQEMDGAKDALGHVFVIAATNIVEQIDSAVLSRFSQKIEIGLPGYQERLQLLSVLLNGRPVDSALTLETIAENTEGYSGRDLRELVSNAFNQAVQRVIEAGLPPSEAQLQEADLLLANQ
ncbi:ATP-binding protein, partial [Azovibrio restrictus]|uniref:AAA family ATPase n=1 Tax=Azovibrio restrictus TaxID=146938 RepID=UPI0026F088CF